MAETRPRRVAAAVITAAFAVAVAGCGHGAPLATPLSLAATSSTPATVPTPNPAVPPSLSPTTPPPTSAAPASPFEDDPAVQGLRAYLAAAASAINARDLTQPALVAVSTPRRLLRAQVLYAPDMGTFYPGPRPVTVVAVRPVSPAATNLLTCSLEEGWSLTKPGGTPARARSVLGLRFEMVLVDGHWKVDDAIVAPEVSCLGVALPTAAP